MKEGWICPRCGKVNAPFMGWCDCKPEEEQVTNTADEQCPCGGLHDWVLLDGNGDYYTSSGFIFKRCSKCGKGKVINFT